MSTTLHMKKGDTAPALTATILAGGAAVNLTLASAIQFNMRTGAHVVSGPATIVDGVNGKVKYVWQAGNTSIAGTYEGSFRVTWSDGTVQSFPGQGDILITIEDDQATAVQSTTADLLSFDEFLIYTGKQPGDVDAAEQAQVEAAITAASEAIRQYTDRQFALNADSVQAPRQFRYDGSGILDIDDASVVNSLSVASTPWTVARVLDATEWIAGPYNQPILTFIEVWSRFTAQSAQMGFKNNLDNPLYVRNQGPIILTVDATWGWVTIPTDVKQAVLWTVESIRSDPSPYTSEAIAGYSRTRRWASPVAVPERAAALLDPYTRTLV